MKTTKRISACLVSGMLALTLCVYGCSAAVETTSEQEQTTEQTELMFIKTDEHPLAFHRINITLQQFDEFIKTYDIKPGDGMYLAPESRVNVW